jgi:hypothetical protein
VISEQPGGRDESGGEASGGSGGGDDGGKNGDTAANGGTGDTAAGAAGTGGAANGGAAVGGAGVAGAAGGAGDVGPAVQVAADSGLPVCAPSTLALRLSTDKVAYEPGEKPAFRFTLTNTSDISCKVDLGPRSVVVTVTDSEDDPVFTSKDCPKTGSVFFEVPAHSSSVRTVTWDRHESSTTCTVKTMAVGPGTYLVEVRTDRATVRLGRQSIRLEQD